jgi:peptidoglycan/xylan/chitin deacetylase (PgdA/CDA1 family)
LVRSGRACYAVRVFAPKIHWPRVTLLAANVVLPAATVAAGMPSLLMWCSFFAHSALLYALMAPWCRWLGPAAMQFVTAQRELWLTIDDGPDGFRSLALAQALAERGVRATFFIKGERLGAQQEIGREAMANGHTLANHTFSHPIGAFAWLMPVRLREEIERCNAALQAVGMGNSRWFRSPLGFKNLWLHWVLRRCGMRLVLWSVRAHDGVVCDPESVIRRVRKQAQPGAVILMHECRPRSNEAILGVVDTLLADGFAFVIPRDEQLR